MNADPSDDTSGRDASRGPDEGALERLTERVRNVRDLKAFEATHRGDGRFTFELQKALSDLSRREAREAADALDELADLVREAGDQA